MGRLLANIKTNKGDIMKKAFDIKKENGTVWIINNTACHIDGKPFQYRQIDEDRAKALCEILNNLQSDSDFLSDVMNIVHNIKYGNWKFEDLIDYIYTETSIDELYEKYDTLHL